MLRRLRQFRGTELQLMLIVLLFFAAGYLLVVFATRQREFIPTVPGVLTILWPSSLPFVLFIAISLAMSWALPRTDQVLLPLVALLTGMGLLLTTRLQPSLDALYGTMYENVAAKQSLWVTMGIVVLSLILFVPWDTIFIRFQHSSLMDWLDHHRYTWLTIGMILTLATFVFGTDPNNSGVRVWFDLGLFHFQPSELLKIILVIFLASYLNEHREMVMGGYRIGPLTFPPLPYLVPLGIMWGIAMATIIFQRDLGAALLLFGVFLAMLAVATDRIFYVIVGLLAFAIGAFALYLSVDVVQDRVMVWLNPWPVAQGVGYQIVQSSYALAAGGLIGTGLGQGLPAIVPAIHTDFVFTAIGEELGFAGTIAILIAYILLIFRGYHIATRVSSRFRGFEHLLAIGLTTILAVQTFVIIGGNLRVIPLTGITLPFISYGGSSILINFLIIGLLLRISAANNAEPSPDSNS